MWLIGKEQLGIGLKIKTVSEPIVNGKSRLFFWEPSWKVRLTETCRNILHYFTGNQTCFWKPRDVLAYMHKRYGLFQTQSEWEGRDSFPNTADKTESQAIWSAVMKDAEN